MTADELLQLPNGGRRYELVQGELRETAPSGADHGLIAARIIISLGGHVNTNHLGDVYAAEAGFRLARKPDTVRAPDGAFIRAERAVRTAAFFEGAPDLVIEVISPSDTYSEVEEKTQDWLRAGTRAVILVDPRTRVVRVHRTEGAVTIADVLEVEDVVPGWRLPLSAIFD